MSSFRDVDWENWNAEMPATLMFLVKGEEVLLIEKQRGIGAGKINGPGGKIDPGETPEQCVIREVKEELCIDVVDPIKMGELFFDMDSMPNIHCHVFTSSAYEGVPTATEEAIPLWSKVSEIPFHKMWEDDQYWLPDMIRGRKFIAKFIFEGEKIKWMDVQFDGDATLNF